MKSFILEEGSKLLINDILVPFIEINQDVMLDDKYFTGYYRDAVENGIRSVRPIFEFDDFLIPIVCKIVMEFSNSPLPDPIKSYTLKKYLINIRDYLQGNNNQMLLKIRNLKSTCGDDAFFLFYFSLNLDLVKVANTCAEYLL